MTFLATIWAIGVFCGPLPNVDGLYLRTHILLSNQVCEPIKNPARYEPRDVALSVFVLAHEEGHANDSTLNDPAHDSTLPYPCGLAGPCEAFADCFAANRIAELGRTLGFSGYRSRWFRSFIHAHRRAGWLGYSPIPQACF